MKDYVLKECVAGGMCCRTETLSCFVPPRDGGGRRFAKPGALNAVRRYVYAQETLAHERATAHAMMSQVPVVQDPDGYREGVGYGLWCASFLGLAGLHRIYLGKYGTGIIWLLTFGLGGIGQFIDLFTMKKLVRDANIREGYLPHPRWAGELNLLAQARTPRVRVMMNIHKELPLSFPGCPPSPDPSPPFTQISRHYLLQRS